MVRKFVATVRAAIALLLAFSGPQYAQAASVTATTGWTCAAELPASVTIDSGSNRLLVFFNVEEQDNGGSATANSVTTVGGQSPTESFQASETTTPNNDYYYDAFIFNESAIDSMSGSTVVGVDDEDEPDDNNLWIFGTVENASQTALSAFTDEQYEHTTDGLIDVTTTSSSGDLIMAFAIKGTNAGGNYDDWDTLTEICEDNPEFARDLGAAAGNGGDNTTTVSYTTMANELGAASLVIPNTSSALLLRRRR